jgi:4-carboxymuconolactone decarboxylase
VRRRGRSREVALIRLAALITARGAVPSYGHSIDLAVAAGVTPDEIVDVLVRLVPVVGVPGVVCEAPKVALALGYDVDAALERPPDW